MGREITLFTIPRAFDGKHRLIQDNSIGSWKRLDPTPEIFLCCNDPGVKEAAERHGCKHIRAMFRSPWGVPLVRDAFGTAQDRTSNELMAYVNADIVLMQRFVKALLAVGKELDQFLMVGRRIDCPYLMDRVIDYSDGWQRLLKKEAKKKGNLHPAYGIDYFGFRKGLYKDMPEFAVGRAAWDNWLVWEPLHKGIPVVDASSYIPCIHLGHKIAKPKGDPEREYNRTLVPKDKRATIDDATWIYDKQGLRRK